ncbi:hypothetical protein N7519_010010 [Penicillium mononematosum]|uniref:uncharacterized protein n=1 Tax=Penicillium mononematosum TaxID=268346 RepID=UPI002547925E|nr:uncharacterized protein N7519_010010 [Penicillium mononematosum]KAJ6179549.1 hypothetical protein N7519_010010 [Penicillium mononematosum]
MLLSMRDVAIIWKRKLSGKTADAIRLIRDCLAKEEQVMESSYPRVMGNSKMLREWEVEENWTEIEWESEEETEKETEEDD